MPRVSVIIVAMNDERYITDAIESVLHQGYRNLELHVQVSAASRDRTLEIVRSTTAKWCSEVDSGIPDAFNRGIRATTGEFVSFLGGDDSLMPGAIESLAAVLQENPEVGFAYSDGLAMNEVGQVFAPIRARAFDLDEMFRSCYIPAQTVMVRRTALEKVGLWRTDIMNADWDLWLRLGAKFPAIYVPLSLARYRVHDGSATLNNLREVARSVCAMANTLLEDPEMIERLKCGRGRALAGVYLVATLTYLRAGDHASAWSTYRTAVSAYPAAAFSRPGLTAAWAACLGPRLYDRFCRRKEHRHFAPAAATSAGNSGG